MVGTHRMDRALVEGQQVVDIHGKVPACFAADMAKVAAGDTVDIADIADKVVEEGCSSVGFHNRGLMGSPAAGYEMGIYPSRTLEQCVCYQSQLVVRLSLNDSESCLDQ